MSFVLCKQRLDLQRLFLLLNLDRLNLTLQLLVLLMNPLFAVIAIPLQGLGLGDLGLECLELHC